MCPGNWDPGHPPVTPQNLIFESYPRCLARPYAPGIPASMRALPEVVLRCGRGAAPAAEVHLTDAPGGFRQRRLVPASFEADRMSPSDPPVGHYDPSGVFAPGDGSAPGCDLERCEPAQKQIHGSARRGKPKIAAHGRRATSFLNLGTAARRPVSSCPNPRQRSGKNRARHQRSSKHKRNLCHWTELGGRRYEPADPAR